MNTPLLGLRTTIYKVTDVAAATKWYTNAFKTEPYFNESFYVGFNIAGYELGLQPDDTPAATKTENVATYWGVENIDDWYNHLINQGATAFEAPENVGGDMMTATVKDPWGNVIGLIYNPYFKLA
jgi:predicted enzyme related to lactoylglutathione lyase